MKKYDLGKEKINKLLIAFAIPCVVSSLINSIYNIVDQIFIGKGVGTLGNAATNVLFPLVILCNAIASLVGNGAAAHMALKLGEKDEDSAKKSVGQSIILTIIISVVMTIISITLLSKMIYWFGCTKDVAPYALDYGRIICLGIPFMIFYSSISSLIRADGSPSYSMKLLVIGAIINIILDPVFIFGFGLGVKGGAYATIIGQIVSSIMAFIYLFKFKSIKLSKEDFKLDKNIFKVLSLGLSSFITQLTVLVLFVYMNNMMTSLGNYTMYGSNIPLSVYGVISKINSLYISIVIGISVGAQPIVGFNYGAGNKNRVKEVLTKLIIINLTCGILFNIIYIFFPEQIANIFVSKSDPTYDLFIDFTKKMCHTFFILSGINALEMTTSVTLQSLGKVRKATATSFARQIILFIPISLILGLALNLGLDGILYAGPIADTLCFILCIFLLIPEYKLLNKKDEIIDTKDTENKLTYNGEKIVITISREYGSGGHYVGELLSQKLGIKFYDKSLIELISNESGLSKNYIKENEEKLESGNDDLIFISQEKIIKKLARESSCVIVGRCADYVLRNNHNTISIFLYSDDVSKVKRVVKYYGLTESKAIKEINKINKERQKHYKYYTNRDWYKLDNYDMAINVDKYGIDKTVDIIINLINERNK